MGLLDRLRAAMSAFAGASAPEAAIPTERDDEIAAEEIVRAKEEEMKMKPTLNLSFHTYDK